jgi:hypothetical protein
MREYTIIYLPANPAKEFKIQISDVSGKSVRIYEIGNNYQLKVEKGDLPSGIYFVELIGDKKYRTKLIIQ